MFLPQFYRERKGRFHDIIDLDGYYKLDEKYRTPEED
jgi:hypothetical protein